MVLKCASENVVAIRKKCDNEKVLRKWQFADKSSLFGSWIAREQGWGRSVHLLEGKSGKDGGSCEKPASIRRQGDGAGFYAKSCVGFGRLLLPQ